MCGVWLDIQTVYSSVPGLYQPMSPRISIGFGMRRWLTMRCLTTTSASSIAASVPSLSPTRPVEDHVVRGVLVELRRAGLHRLLGVDDGRAAAPSRPVIASSASYACSGVSATTAATPSPVHLTLSVARTRGVLTLFWMPGAAAGRPGHRQRVVRDVGARRTPRSRRASTSAARRVDRADVGVGVRAAQDGHVGHRLELDVVEVAALAGDEAGVLDPLDALRRGRGRGASSTSVIVVLAVYAGVAGGVRRVAHRLGRGSRIAATMLW